MGTTASKETESDIQMQENMADQSIDSGSDISPFMRLKNVSFNNRYERFSTNKQSLSMNNLEGELTPKKIPNSGLKQRLIKALGGYSTLDPRSPSQVIARTPLAFEKRKNDRNDCYKKNLETSIFSDNAEFENEESKENPYSIFEENLNDQGIITSEQSKNLVDDFDGLVITKDPRSPSDGITRTPLAFAVGTLQTPSIEMLQSFTHDVEEKITVTTKTEKNETKTENKSATQRIKTIYKRSIYKDFVRRDQIHANLLNEDENEIDISRTTPMKKSMESFGNRTPLSCVANRTRSKPIQPKKLLGNAFEDNFSPKIDSKLFGEENTPIHQVGGKISRIKVDSLSKSKIPVGRNHRFH